MLSLITHASILSTSTAKGSSINMYHKNSVISFQNFCLDTGKQISIKSQQNNHLFLNACLELFSLEDRKVISMVLHYYATRLAAVADLGEGAGGPPPLILGRKRRNDGREKGQQGK